MTTSRCARSPTRSNRRSTGSTGSTKRRYSMKKLGQAAAGAALLAAAPAAAERVETYWRLEPVLAEAPAHVPFDAPFFEQRLLPVRLVALTEPLTVGDKTLVAGTFLYLVFNADRKI